MRRGLRTLLGISAAGLAALAACAPPAQIRYERGLEAAPAPAVHAVHDERLRQVMRVIERLDFERLPQALDKREERGRWVEELRGLAGALAASAESIRSVAPDLELEEHERETFLALTTRLQERARALEREADELPAEALRERARGIEETCDRCHERFRIPRYPGSAR